MISYWDEQRPSSSDTGQGTYLYDSDKQVYIYHGLSRSGKKEESWARLSEIRRTWTCNPATETGEMMNGRFTVRELSPTFLQLQV